MRYAAIRMGWAALLSAVVVAPLHATTSIHVDTRELVESSSDIVVGTIESTFCRWDETHTRIVTEVSVRVSRSLKGESQRLTLVQLGGDLDGMRYTIPGSPAFRPGEEALLFVWRDRQGRAQVNALAQGKFDIRQDPATGEKLVQRGLPGLAIHDARTLGLIPTGRVAPRITLGGMLKEVERVLKEEGR